MDEFANSTMEHCPIMFVPERILIDWNDLTATQRIMAKFPGIILAQSSIVYTVYDVKYSLHNRMNMSAKIFETTCWTLGILTLSNVLCTTNWTQMQQYLETVEF